MGKAKISVRVTLLVLALIGLLGVAGAQERGFYAWVPEGEPRFLAPFGEGHENSIRSVADEYFPGLRFYSHFVPEEVSGDESAVILFRWLTDEPLFALTGFPDRIEEYASSFDVREFLSSWMLEFELSMALQDEAPVIDVMILEGLGGPSSRVTRTTATGQGERWEYAQYRLVLYFSRGVLVEVVTY